MSKVYLLIDTWNTPSEVLAVYKTYELAEHAAKTHGVLSYCIEEFIVNE